MNSERYKESMELATISPHLIAKPSAISLMYLRHLTFRHRYHHREHFSTLGWTCALLQAATRDENNGPKPTLLNLRAPHPLRQSTLVNRLVTGTEMKSKSTYVVESPDPHCSRHRNFRTCSTVRLRSRRALVDVVRYFLLEGLGHGR
jgi:hypothetical protein